MLGELSRGALSLGSPWQLAALADIVFLYRARDFTGHFGALIATC
jgi:hypothetical protein